MYKIIVGGSIAYDNIMCFPGLFKDHVLSDQLHELNISFLVNSLERLKGGTAPNIAYNLSLVGLKPTIIGTAGKDFHEYKFWLEDNGVDTSQIRVIESDYTATCFINTDQEHNQLTSFYPGPMIRDSEISIKQMDLSDVKMVVIAPTDPVAMVKWAAECRELGVPYLFDAGMQIPRMSSEDLSEGVLGSEIAVFNNYEYRMMINKTGLTCNAILDSVKLLVVTMGKEGAVLRTKDCEVMVPAAIPSCVVDPTGAGDAFRAGLIKGYLENKPLEVIGRYANVSAVYAVEQKGGTAHKYTIEDFYNRCIENYNEV
jgi:adenosine kinase